MRQSKENARIIYEAVKEAGIDFVVTVPDSWLNEVNVLLSQDEKIKYVLATREEEGVGVAAGAFLGGKQVALTMEITGLGNSLTALGRLNLGSRIPLLILTSYRGTIGEMFGFASGHSARFDQVLQVMGIPYHVLRNIQEAKRVIKDAQRTAQAQRIPTAILLTSSVLWEEE